MVKQGDLSKGRQALVAPALAPGTETTLRQLQDEKQGPLNLSAKKTASHAANGIEYMF